MSNILSIESKLLPFLLIFFSTGTLSPVNTPWLTNKSSNKIASLGIILPALSSIISPTTISLVGISFTIPCLITVVTVNILDFSLKSNL